MAKKKKITVVSVRSRDDENKNGLWNLSDFIKMISKEVKSKKCYTPKSVASGLGKASKEALAREYHPDYYPKYYINRDSWTTANKGKKKNKIVNINKENTTFISLKCGPALYEI